MILLEGIEQGEFRPEKRGNCTLVSPEDRQAAAASRTIWGEPRDQDEAAGPHGTTERLRIGGPVPLLRQEVQDRLVVPEVDGEIGLPSGKVGQDEADRLPLVAEARPCLRQRGVRDVEHDNVGITLIKQEVRQVRGASPTSRMLASFGRLQARIRRREVSGVAWNQLTASSALAVKMLFQCSCRVPDIGCSIEPDASAMVT